MNSQPKGARLNGISISNHYNTLGGYQGCYRCLAGLGLRRFSVWVATPPALFSLLNNVGDEFTQNLRIVGQNDNDDIQPLTL